MKRVPIAFLTVFLLLAPITALAETTLPTGDEFPMCEEQFVDVDDGIINDEESSIEPIAVVPTDEQGSSPEGPAVLDQPASTDIDPYEGGILTRTPLSTPLPSLLSLTVGSSRMESATTAMLKQGY